MPHGVKIMISKLEVKESEANEDHVAFTDTHLPD